MKRVIGLALAAGVVLLMGVLPLFAPSYLIILLLLTLMYTALASSWNLISGYTGYVSFGHVAFFGLGAYAAAILITKQGMNWVAASIIAGLVAIVIALLVGSITLRLKGPYFAIAMLGLSEAFRVIAAAWEPLTRGGSGIYLPPVLSVVPVYYAIGLCTVAVVALTFWVSNSKFGLRLMAIREDEVAAEALGINTTLYKLAAFAASAFFPGVLGGFYAWYLSYIAPDSVFDVGITIRMIIMVMFGGPGTVFGPVIGGISLTLLAETFWASFPEFHQALFGLLMVVIVLFLRGGVLGFLKDRGLLPKGRWY